MITYLFSPPKVGDAILFMPALNDSNTDNYFLGIITNIDQDKEVKTYEVLSKPGDPWQITADKIKEKIYYPKVAPDLFQKAQRETTFTRTTIPTKETTATQEQTNGSDWKIYTSVYNDFVFKYPKDWILIEENDLSGEYTVTVSSNETWGNSKLASIGDIGSTSGQISYASFSLTFKRGVPKWSVSSFSSWLKEGTDTFSLAGEIQATSLGGKSVLQYKYYTPGLFSDPNQAYAFIDSNGDLYEVGVGNYESHFFKNSTKYQKILDQIISTFKFTK